MEANLEIYDRGQVFETEKEVALHGIIQIIINLSKSNLSVEHGFVSQCLNYRSNNHDKKKFEYLLKLIEKMKDKQEIEKAQKYFKIKQYQTEIIDLAKTFQNLNELAGIMNTLIVVNGEIIRDSLEKNFILIVHIEKTEGKPWLKLLKITRSDKMFYLRILRNLKNVNVEPLKNEISSPPAVLESVPVSKNIVPEGDSAVEPEENKKNFPGSKQSDPTTPQNEVNLNLPQHYQQISPKHNQPRSPQNYQQSPLEHNKINTSENHNQIPPQNNQISPPHSHTNPHNQSPSNSLKFNTFFAESENGQIKLYTVQGQHGYFKPTLYSDEKVKEILASKENRKHLVRTEEINLNFDLPGQQPIPKSQIRSSRHYDY